MGTVTKQKIDFIQALRGVAALAVVLYHGSQFISPFGQGIGNLIFGRAGTLGVVMFFLISGFIMVHTTINKPMSARFALEFFVRRFSRVWPLLVIVASVYAAFITFIYRAGSKQLLHDYLLSLCFVPPGDGPQPSFGNTIPPAAWTLNYEMYFYGMFAVSMLFRRLRWIFLAAWAALTLIAIPLLQFGSWSTQTYVTYSFSSSYLKLMTFPVVWDFLAGCGIALLYHSSFKLPTWLSSRFACTIATSFVIWQYVESFRIGLGITEWGMTLIPMLLIFSQANKTRRLETHPGLTQLGNISYSLYLWHGFIYFIGVYPLAWLGHGEMTTGWSYTIFTTILAVIVAKISATYIENGICIKVRDFLLSTIVDKQTREFNTRFTG